jgi:(p)ppGpp synthase/HD superfamily hydrolase
MSDKICITEVQRAKYIAACLFAQEAHKGQVRKYTGEPYFFHVLEVAQIVEQVTNDVNMWCAAVLHDTVEDCGITLTQITEEFGSDVADLVEWLTDVSRPEDGNRAARKEIDRRHTAAASPRAKTIKLADFLSNMQNIADKDPKFAAVYCKEKRALMPDLVQGDSTLYARAMALLEKVEAQLNEQSKNR